MSGFENYIIIFVLALILFGPKKLPELARQLGKLMGEFRRASNEFKMQMEEELRTTERAEQEKKVAALEAAAPPPVMLEGGSAEVAPVVPLDPALAERVAAEEKEHLEIAKAGELTMRPPASGLPVSQSFGADPKLEAVLSQATMPAAAETAPTEPETKPENPSADAVNALSDSVPLAEGQTTHG